MIKDDIGNRNIIFKRQDKRKSAGEEWDGEKKFCSTVFVIHAYLNFQYLRKNLLIWRLYPPPAPPPCYRSEIEPMQALYKGSSQTAYKKHIKNVHFQDVN